MRLRLSGFALTAAALFATSSLHAQAPAGAPAGTNGICKDGTYSTATRKDGACRGHKGVQTWYVASSAASPSAPMTSPSVGAPSINRPAAPVMPAPRPTAAAPAMPAPVPATSLTPAVPSTRRTTSTALASKTAAPGGGPGLVWVNTSSNVYHCNGDDVYGKTKAGAYMSEADAKAKGARGARGQSCAGK